MRGILLPKATGGRAAVTTVRSFVGDVISLKPNCHGGREPPHRWNTTCSATQYCPTGYVFRAHMAAFLVRALDLPYVDEDFFSDDEGSPYEADINALADAGIATGCGGGRFCPGARVTRAQMASFLVRGFDLPPSGTNYFTDDNSSLHEDDINALRASGITGGCTATTYCPNQFITREQMAAFLYRALPH